MDRVTIVSRVGADGVLHVSVPLGPSDANLPVQVTIEATGHPPKTDQPPKNGSADYRVWLDGLAGKWQGDFVRGDEGHFESREPLS
jgi:hypothetical protein